jgi:hypothetical protein
MDTRTTRKIGISIVAVVALGIALGVSACGGSPSSGGAGGGQQLHDNLAWPECAVTDFQQGGEIFVTVKNMGPTAQHVSSVTIVFSTGGTLTYQVSFTVPAKSGRLESIAPASAPANCQVEGWTP